jgi:hypothetical protein
MLHNTLVEVRLADLLANDIDVDGVALAVINVTQPANGIVIDNGDGTLTYRPHVGFTGADSFTYTVSDDNGASDTAVVTVQVSFRALNDPPPDDETPTDSGEDDPPATEPDRPTEVPIETGTDTDRSGDSGDHARARGLHGRHHAGDAYRGASPAVLRPVAQEPLLWLDSADAFTTLTHESVAGGGFRTFARQVHKAANHVSQIAQSTLDVSSLWERLDVFREDLAGDRRGFTVGVVITTGTLTLLTMGYAAWTIRGGYLLSSILASLPAWHMVDPLPILAASCDSQKTRNHDSGNEPEKPQHPSTTSDAGTTLASLATTRARAR